MGLDKPDKHQDHCYMDDPADGVGMNVEIIDDNYQATQNVMIEKPVLRYIDISGSSSSQMNVSYEDSNRLSKKALVYLPFNEYCTDHTDLFLHEDEKLVKPGDKFSSHEEFVQYLNEHAKRWCFYYRCSDSRKPKTDYESYTYNCVYLRNKEKYKNKGLRKRNNAMKTDCPCKIKVRHLPNEKELTVVYVCNHHDHDLSLEGFYKLQHGRRLPPYVKEEIKDFLTLKVDVKKIRAYVEMETGFRMSRPFFYGLEKNMKNGNVVRRITPQRLALLKEKLAVTDEMYGYDYGESMDDQPEHIENQADDIETPKIIKQRRSLKNADKAKRNPPKRRSKANDAGTSSDDSKRIKIDHLDNSYNSETYQSVKNLQESVKCEIQRNPWVSDQFVPVLPNRTAIKSDGDESSNIETVEHLQDDVHSIMAQSKTETYTTYTIEYYNPEDGSTYEIACNEFGEIIEDGQVNVKVEGNNKDNNITYETVATDGINETQTLVEEYLDEDEIMQEDVDQDQSTNEGVETHIDSQDQSEIINEDFDNTQDLSEVEKDVEYLTGEIEDNDDGVEYLEDTNQEDDTQDIDAQETNNSSSSHSLLPVFDVYMKDGNVTGFVVNNNMISGLKDGVDKEIQTSEELMLSDSQDLGSQDIDGEIIHELTNGKHGDTYIKHEYVHKYNLEKYMVQPHFPKYVETLAKETDMDVLHMFTNIYNEKAMFKITTTQKGKEGNTRIWYITDFSRSRRHRKYEATREKLGRNLQSIFILKEKLRAMKKRNKELMSWNKQLEEVALKLVDMT